MENTNNLKSKLFTIANNKMLKGSYNIFFYLISLINVVLVILMSHSHVVSELVVIVTISILIEERNCKNKERRKEKTSCEE
jgi:hypothetical protein